MKMSKNIITNSKYTKKFIRIYIKINIFEFKSARDGNCWYRTLLNYFIGKQYNHKVFRRLIYEATKNNKENLLLFFLEDCQETDDIIENMKIENYIEEIKKDKFYAGNIELAISSILFNFNISLYIDENSADTFYTHYMNIWKDINDDDIMLVLFTNNIHYFLLSEKKQLNKQDKIKYEKMKIPIIALKNNKNKFNFKNKIPPNLLCSVSNNKLY